MAAQLYVAKCNQQKPLIKHAGSPILTALDAKPTPHKELVAKLDPQISTPDNSGGTYQSHKHILIIYVTDPHRF